jgi:hypothetical protein
MAKRKSGAARPTSKKIVSVVPPRCPHCNGQKYIKVGGLPTTECQATGKVVKRSMARCQSCDKNYILQEIFDLKK